MANSVDPNQTAPRSTLFASFLNLSVVLGNYLQQTTSADDIFTHLFLRSEDSVHKIHILGRIIITSFDNLKKINMKNHFSLIVLLFRLFKVCYIIYGSHMLFHALTFAGTRGSCLNESNRLSAQTSPKGPSKC